MQNKRNTTDNVSQKENGKFVHIGMRKIKSIMAIFVSFWIWQLVRVFFPALEIHPIYMYIYGLIEMRDSSEKTVDFGKRRIKATFSGFVVGLPVLTLLGVLQTHLEFEWMHTAAEVLLIMAGVLITIGVAQKVGCKTFCGLAAAIFIILVVSHNDDERYIYCVLRAFQTLVGVFVAWLINVKIFPYPKRTKNEEAEKIIPEKSETQTII